VPGTHNGKMECGNFVESINPFASLRPIGCTDIHVHIVVGDIACYNPSRQRF